MNKRKVLVVDDESRMRKLVRDFLVRQDFEVLEAGDGEEALETFYRNKDIALILMDVMMPKMNGYEATKAIRSLDDRPDGRTIPIIAMTANAFAEDVQASLDAGMNGHLSKPIVMDEVVKTIARNLNR